MPTTPVSSRSGPIVTCCRFVRRVVDEAQARTYREWWLLLRIAGACEGGAELVHRLSAQSPKYDFKATEYRLSQPWGRVPPLCSTIQQRFPSDCAGCPCPSLGIRSPIALGMMGDEETDA